MNIEDRRFTKIWAGCIRLKMIGKSLKMKDVGARDGVGWNYMPPDGLILTPKQREVNTAREKLARSFRGS